MYDFVYIYLELLVCVLFHDSPLHSHSSMVRASDDSTLQDLPRGQSSTKSGSAKVYGMMTRHWSVRDIRKPLQKQVRRRATSGEPAGTTGRKRQGSCREEKTPCQDGHYKKKTWRLVREWWEGLRLRGVATTPSQGLGEDTLYQELSNHHLLNIMHH